MLQCSSKQTNQLCKYSKLQQAGQLNASLANCLNINMAEMAPCGTILKFHLWRFFCGRNLKVAIFSGNV
jgi:hypothetical protein